MPKKSIKKVKKTTKPPQTMMAPPKPKPDSCMQFADCVGLDGAAAEGLNFVFSPLSIRAALSLAAAGSNGPTLDQFLSFLGSDTLDDLNSAAKSLLASVTTATDSNPNPRNHGDGGSYLSLANGVWVDHTLVLKPKFKETAATVYNAEARSVDFINKGFEVAEEVNTWAERQTKGLIKKLISPSEVKIETRLILVSTVYFKGTWLWEFDRSDTSDEEFHLLDGTTIEAPFMHRRPGACAHIASFDGFKVLKMAYKPSQPSSGQFSMLVFLPDERHGLRDLVAKAVAGAGFFEEHVPAEPVHVRKFWIPKFKISCGFEPSGVLPRLGLDLPFDEGRADLTETAFHSRPDFKLVVSSVRHKATIEVGEEDTEAAAATEVSDDDMGCCLFDGPPSPPPVVDFVADHPFMFAIREGQSGAILFVGHVVDPSSTKETIIPS